MSNDKKDNFELVLAKLKLTDEPVVLRAMLGTWQAMESVTKHAAEHRVYRQELANKMVDELISLNTTYHKFLMARELYLIDECRDRIELAEKFLIDLQEGRKEYTKRGGKI